MQLKFSLLLLTISFCLLSTTIIFLKKEGVHKSNITLNDGETLEIEPLINPTQKDDLIKENLITVNNSAIIRSFETDSNNVMDIMTYANSIASYRNLGYWSVIPNITYATSLSEISSKPQAKLNESNYYGLIASDNVVRDRISSSVYAFYTPNDTYDWKKIDGFDNYYHRLFKNKTARTLLTEQGIEIVCNLCKEFPSDFKALMLKELAQLLQFTNYLNTSKKIDTDNLNDYWKGFIFRRNKFDNVPLNEIQATLIKAQTKIKALDVSKQPDAMYEININSQVTLYYSCEKFTFSSNNSSKEISFTYETTVQNVKYLKDITGEYYQLSGFKNSKPFTYLYDKNLTKIE